MEGHVVHGPHHNLRAGLYAFTEKWRLTQELTKDLLQQI